MEADDKNTPKHVGEEEEEEEGVVKYRGIKAMPFVIGNETFEKLGTIGTSSNLLVYLTTVFKMKHFTATTLINAFNGSTNFSPLMGAFLSDSFYGRYAILAVASISSFTGMLILTLTATFSALHPPSCHNVDGCEGASLLQLAFLFSSFVFLVVGAGGIRSCNLPFGADQFNPATSSGKRGISSFFNWYYFTYTFAMMVSLTLIVYVQSNISWAIGLAIPTLLMFLSCVVFFLGTRIYVRVRPEGSPLTGIAQVLVSASKKTHLSLPEQPWSSLFNPAKPGGSINAVLPYTPQFRFLDKGAIRTGEDEVTDTGVAAHPWRLSTMQKVEEVKCLVRVIPIWFAGVVFGISNVQQQTYVVLQALQSDRRFGAHHFQIPAASYVAFSMLGLTFWIPIYDRLLIPILRRLTGKPDGITILQKIGTGMVVSVFTMLTSSFVEQRRRAAVAPASSISSMSAMWLVPQLLLSGLSEAFATVGLVEFYYKQFPENMRSMGVGVLFSGFAGASYSSALLVMVVHRATAGGTEWLPENLNMGRLDYFYYMIAALEVLNLCYFVSVARWYKYKGVELEISLERTHHPLI